MSTPRRMRWIGITALMLTGTAGCSPPGAVSVEYIGHAAFLITSSEGNRVLVDPYGSRIWIGYDFPDQVQTDAILISHPHYDHDAGVSRGREFSWDSTVTPVYRAPGTYHVGDITVTGVEGKHADPYGMEFGQINTVWIIEADGVRFAHWGDNGPLTDGLRTSLTSIDVLMLPIDSAYHILSQDAIDEIVRGVAPKRLVPMHYALPQLEPARLPDDLGPIDPWLIGRGVFERVGTSTTLTSPVPDPPTIMIFDPSACERLANAC